MFKNLILVASIMLTAGVASAQYGRNTDLLRDLDDCARICSRQCMQLTDLVQRRLDATVSSCTAQTPVDQALYQSAYEYAYGGNGLNLTKAEAQAFADKITSIPNGRVVLETFKTAYEYAYGGNGLNLIKSEAMTFAWKMVGQRLPNQALSCYKDAFQYAYSGNGLNLTKAEAMNHAVRSCRIQ